ncbi:MAG: acyl-CoA dehydratase activase [Candidatus Cloacimonadales bacterium]|jgi:predicted CoA-substrate-specific enzyme activase|nr:acyl-CoA dehydratase activase [Candidatus Cloacimonadota bacterium]MDD2650705.1 acyl-CoA dehydratase activase [Candidatus Cloacimonadota bacterium]MDX9977225.1 acyl-CoA dehydratase activase [Candidatus Cloacimonadales bacterium]
MKVSVGIDCGSRTVKAVIFDCETKEIIDYGILDNGLFPLKNINKLLDNILIKNQIKPYDIASLAGTGYGRNSVNLHNLNSLKNQQIPLFTFSEITCHGKGSSYLLPDCHTIIDIGGQDSKVILIDDKGKTIDFVMNDKCAAGTGRFLEKLAQILDMSLDMLDPLAKQHDRKIIISSTCVVFAESEIIGLLANEEKAENIIYSIYSSIARRVFSQSGTLSLTKPISFVGGVAHHETIKEIFSELYECEIKSPENPSIAGALGAAILANDSLERAKK